MLGPRKSFYRPLSREVDDDSHAWLLTFADAVTLLLAFFVMMMSFSKVDIITFEQVKVGIARDLGQRSILRPAAQLRSELDTLVDSLGVADAVSVNICERGIVLELASNAFYLPGPRPCARKPVRFSNGLPGRFAIRPTASSGSPSRATQTTTRFLTRSSLLIVNYRARAPLTSCVCLQCRKFPCAGCAVWRLQIPSRKFSIVTVLAQHCPRIKPGIDAL